MLPGSGVPRLVVIHQLLLVNRGKVGNGVLLDDAEALAVHGSGDETLEKLVVQNLQGLCGHAVVVGVALVLQVLDGGRQGGDHVPSGFPNAPALTDRNHVGAMPRQLLQDRDQDVD